MKHKWDKQKMNSKMIGLSPTILIAVLNINGLNTPFDYQTGEKARPNQMQSLRNHFKGKDIC